MIIHLGTQAGNDGVLTILAHIQHGEVLDRRQITTEWALDTLDDNHNAAANFKKHNEKVRDAMQDWQEEIK